MTETIAGLDAAGSKFSFANFQATMSLTCATAGLGQEARKWAEQVLEFSPQLSQRFSDGFALMALAMAAARENPPDWATMHSRMAEALAFAEERGMRPLTGETHFRHAELLQKKGDLPKAREQLEQAGALFREMEMTWWLEQAEALRKSLETGSVLASKL